MRFNLVLTLGVTAAVVAAAPAAAPEPHWGRHRGHDATRTRTRTKGVFPTGTAPYGTGHPTIPTLATSYVVAPTDAEPTPTGAPGGDDSGDDGDDGDDGDNEDSGDGEGSGDDGSTGPVYTRTKTKGTGSAPTAKPSASQATSSDDSEATTPETAPATVPATPATTTTSLAPGYATASSSPVASSAPSSGSLWQPAVGSSWQIILSEQVNPDTTLSPDVDVFDIDMQTTPAETIQKLKAKGKHVICYFSAGSSEEGRPDNAALQAYKGSGLEGWPGENWLDIRQQGVRDVMKARIASSAEKGCDAIDPDNVDGYNNVNGLGLTEADAIDYIKFLSTEAAAKGMSTGLKNAGEIIDQVLPNVAFSVNEQCNQYNECGTFAKFITAGKPVFNIEYTSSKKKRSHPAPLLAKRAELNKRASCPSSQPSFSSVIKNMDLSGWTQLCTGATVTTATTSSSGKSS